MGVVEFHECPAPIRNPGRAKVRCPSEGWELQWEVTERVRGPNRWDALHMTGMIIDAIHTNEIEFNNQETLSLWTGLISRLVECENSYLQDLCCFPSFWYTTHTEIIPTLELL